MTIKDKFFLVALIFVISFLYVSAQTMPDRSNIAVEYEIKLSADVICAGDDFTIVTSFSNTTEETVSVLGDQLGTFFRFRALNGDQLKPKILKFSHYARLFPRGAFITLPPGGAYVFETPAELSVGGDDKLYVQLKDGMAQFKVAEEGIKFVAEYFVSEKAQKKSAGYGISSLCTNELAAEIRYMQGTNSLIRIGK